MTMTMAQFNNLAPGESVRDTTTSAIWTVNADGLSISNGEVVVALATFPYDGALDALEPVTTPPPFEVGQWRGIEGHPDRMAYIHYLIDDEVVWSTWARGDDHWHLAGARRMPRTSIRFGEVTTSPGHAHVNMEAAVEWTRQLAEPAPAPAPVEPVQQFDRDRLEEWLRSMVSDGSATETELREIARDLGIDVTETEEVEVTVVISGTVSVYESNDERINGMVGMSLPAWTDSADFRVSWSTSGLIMAAVDEGDCACNEVTDEQIEELLRGNGYGDIVDNGEDYSVQRSCRND